MAIAFNAKSGPGISDGVVSELTAFFGVKPGHEEQLRAALVSFADTVRNLDPRETQKTGLRDMRHVMFDCDRRLLWCTTFETDWDPYLDDALIVVGIEHFIGWMQHLTEAKELVAWLDSVGGAEKLRKASTAEFAEAVKGKSSGLKSVIRSCQIQATTYWNCLSDLTIPQIRKSTRVETAFQKVLDNPAAGEVLQKPVMQPLLEEAAA